MAHVSWFLFTPDADTDPYDNNLALHLNLGMKSRYDAGSATYRSKLYWAAGFEVITPVTREVRFLGEIFNGDPFFLRRKVSRLSNRLSLVQESHGPDRPSLSGLTERFAGNASPDGCGVFSRLELYDSGRPTRVIRCLQIITLNFEATQMQLDYVHDNGRQIPFGLPHLTRLFFLAKLPC